MNEVKETINNSENEIKDLYYFLAKKLHPDVIQNYEDPKLVKMAHELMIIINRAYEEKNLSLLRNGYKNYQRFLKENMEKDNLSRAQRIKGETIENSGLVDVVQNKPINSSNNTSNGKNANDETKSNVIYFDHFVEQKNYI